MAEKFLLNYILPLRNNQHLLSKEIEEQLSIMDTTLWTNTIQEYLKSDAHSIFTLAITGSKEYKEATINEDLIPENIKAITNKTYLDYNFDQKNTEALQLQINQDFDYEMTAYIRSVYRSMFQEISDLFINFLQQKIKEADLNYKKTII